MTSSLTPIDKRAKAFDVIGAVRDGATLRKALTAHQMHPETFYACLQSDREAAIAYCRARELRSDTLVDEALELADGDGDPAKVRNQIEIRKWTASKHHSKLYGDRIDLNVTQTIDISSTLAEARSRLLPVRDQAKAIDAQTVDYIDISPSATPDKQSVRRVIDRPTGEEMPDIFG